MPKVSTNINLDAELKKSAQELYADLGMDMTTAVTLFLKQSVREQAIPFAIRRNKPNAETEAAMQEYDEMQKHPENYKHYRSVDDLMTDILGHA